MLVNRNLFMNYYDDFECNTILMTFLVRSFVSINPSSSVIQRSCLTDFSQQAIFGDERFQSSFECEGEERWMPTQILNTVMCTPSLPEEIQMEIMKVSDGALHAH